MHSPLKLNISVNYLNFITLQHHDGHGAAVLKNSNYFLLFPHVVQQEIKEGKLCFLVCRPNKLSTSGKTINCSGRTLNRQKTMRNYHLLQQSLVGKVGLTIFIIEASEGN